MTTLASRQTFREAIATLIRSKSVLAQGVFAFQPSDLGGASPVVVVTSSGSERPRMTLRGVKTRFHIGIETFVLYSDPDATPPWTAQDAENTMDGLEKEIAEIVADNVKGSCWEHLEYETVSVADKITFGGVAYLYEAIPLVAEVL